MCMNGIIQKMEHYHTCWLLSTCAYHSWEQGSITLDKKNMHGFEPEATRAPTRNIGNFIPNSYMYVVTSFASMQIATENDAT